MSDVKIASTQKLAANRINGRKSSGPTSRAGKRVVSRNTTRHGVLAQVIALDDDERVAFDALIEGLTADLRPMGALEELLVEKIAQIMLRNRRLSRAAAATYALKTKNSALAKVVSAELSGDRPVRVEPDPRGL